jgi:hypothetical protein
MRWSDVPLNPSPSTLRWFGVLCSLFVAALAGRQVLVAGGVMPAAAGFAGALVVLGAALVRPALLRPVFAGSMVLLFPVNWLVAHLLLGCVYYCVFTPLGLFFKLMRRDVLGRALQRERGSYWIDKSAASDPARYFRPF